MTKKEFLECMEEVKSHWRWDQVSGPFTCNLIYDELSYEARDEYRWIFSENTKRFDTYIPAYFCGDDDDLNDAEEIKCTRIAAITMFEQICLEELLYKEF